MSSSTVMIVNRKKREVAGGKKEVQSADATEESKIKIILTIKHRVQNPRRVTKHHQKL